MILKRTYRQGYIDALNRVQEAIDSELTPWTHENIQPPMAGLNTMTRHTMRVRRETHRRLQAILDRLKP